MSGVVVRTAAEIKFSSLSVHRFLGLVFRSVLCYYARGIVNHDLMSYEMGIHLRHGERQYCLVTALHQFLSSSPVFGVFWINISLAMRPGFVKRTFNFFIDLSKCCTLFISKLSWLLSHKVWNLPSGFQKMGFQGCRY